MNNRVNPELEKLTKSKLSEGEQIQLSKTPPQIAATREKMKLICTSLSCSTSDFQPADTAKAIYELLHSNMYLSRILYSEFSNYLFTLNDYAKGIFDTNIENLFQYVTDEVNDDDVKEFVIRIYDHCQLAKTQVENIDHMLKDRIEEAKKSIETDSKRLEKEYISILGIFASVVLAFIGGSMFSTSVLENIANTNIYRIVFITDFLAFVVVNLVYLLVMFIIRINEMPRENFSVFMRKKGEVRIKRKKENFFPIKTFYIICFAVALLDIAAWIIDFGVLARVIRSFLPWIA